MKTKEELKTLKDIDKDCYSFSEHQEVMDDLRDEAVKWVKDILRDDENYKLNNLRAEYFGTIEWIKHFFNLTEEDLKQDDR